MISTLLRINWLNLKRDRVALALTYLLPIGFFSIFALVFGSMATSGGGVGGSEGLLVLLVDEDHSDASQRMASALGQRSELRIRSAPLASDTLPDPQPWTRDEAITLVRTGKAPAAIIIPAGFGTNFGSFQTDTTVIDLVYDAANPLAQYTVTGMLQAVSFQAAPDLMLESGMKALTDYGGGELTPLQRMAIEKIKPFLRNQATGEASDEEDGADGGSADDASADGETNDNGGGFQGLISINATAAQTGGENNAPPDMVAYYAAAVGVMFLLFSMVGAAGSILEQEEFGTLERLLTSNLSLTTLLLGNWLFFAIIGVLQLIVMFIWAALIFGLNLLEPAALVSFMVMTIVTAAAAAGFGMMLATLCRSRGQLSGLSTIIILTMSALGGSMMPKFIAPFLETTSKFTFNGWALDGYLKIFWYREADSGIIDVLISIVPQVAVIAIAAVVFLAVARLAARRWDRA